MHDRQQDQWLPPHRPDPFFWWVCAVLAVIVALSLLFPMVARAEDMPIPVQTILLEAQGEGFDGMLAVGNVIRNRAKKSGESFDSVCLQRYQFSCWNNLSAAEAKDRILQIRPSIIQRAYRAWEESADLNLVGESRHYHVRGSLPYWASGEKPDYKINKHYFYEGIK